MANWTITATTIYCDSVEDEVTLIVKNDGTVQCTGYNRYNKPTGETARLMKIKSKQAGKQLVCEGLECSRVTRYLNKLLAEEGESTGRNSGGE
jgi:hypothetical protein